MEAMCSLETPVDFQRPTRHYIPEDRNPYNRCDEVSKSPRWLRNGYVYNENSALWSEWKL
jgi:hypothetical protein